MFRVKKEVTIIAAHYIKGHPTCGQMHGHNYRIIVECAASELTIPGAMVTDFNDIKKVVAKLDHSCLNDHLGNYPTAEHLTRYIGERIDNCVSVVVWETDTSCATWEK